MRALVLYVPAWLFVVATLVYDSPSTKVIAATVNQATVANDRGALGARGSLSLSGAPSWCEQSLSAPTVWQKVESQPQTVLGKPDVHVCSVLDIPVTDSQMDVAYIQTVIETPSKPWVQLFQALLLDCDAGFWKQSGIQDLEHICLAQTAALRASCNQWLLTPPADGQTESHSCAPPGTAFARSADLTGRVLVLQAHWRLKPDLIDTSVQLPALTVSLGAVAVSTAAVAGSQATPPALLGSFVGSAVYQPSSMFQSFPALSVPGGLQEASASFMCGKRCTFKPLGRMTPRPVTVVGYSVTTFERATAVSVEIQRGSAGKKFGDVVLQQAVMQAADGAVALEEPLQLLPGDVVKWRCTYNTSDVSNSASIKGGYSTNRDSLQEQCTVVLHYWPRVDTMRGCLSAMVDDVQRGENMCSSEAEDLLQITQAEAQQFPMRRMYDEHSFPKAAWMGGWKATHIVLEMLAVLCCLWGSQTMLANCKFLGSWHRRFQQLHPGQQRNVSVYITHLILDTVCLAVVARPMVELWLGISETTADVLAGEWGFSYLVACYILELTWRRSVDTMLAVHHIGTVAVVVLYAGELTPYTYRVANTIIVLGAFALLEQPTYVALLFKRMLPASSPHVYRSAYVGYISWFAFKALSILLASRMFIEDWHLMPHWIRINFVLTWLVAMIVQLWSGLIQYGIYKQARRSYKAATAWQLKAGLLRVPDDSSSDAEDPGVVSEQIGSPISSEGSEDCIAAVTDADELLGSGFAPFTGQHVPSTLTAAAVQQLPNSARLHAELSPASSGSLAASIAGSPVELNPSKGNKRSRGKQVRLSMPGQQGLADNGGSGSGDDEGTAGCSSGARVYHTEKGTSQRRSKSGLLNLMECGLGSGIAGQED